SAVVAVQVDAARSLPDELQPAGFEMLTAAGILVASRARADVVVCEVGLGGRLDSTNVLDLGVAVLTNVALDHQEYLGTTVAEIAREKAAIIKLGNDVVTAAQSPAVRGGCAEVRWPGRMQWIDGAPPAIVDGAHNPAAMAALVRSLPDVAAGRRVVAVFAAMRNKDIASMAARVNEATDDVIVTA